MLMESFFTKRIVAGIVTVFLFSSCSIKNEGEIDLGSNLHYLPAPAFNSVVIADNNQETSDKQLISGIEAIGYNYHYIMAVSDRGNKEYWYIDKLAIKDAAAESLNNKVKKINRDIFNKMLLQNDITLKTKQDYRITLEYNR